MFLLYNCVLQLGQMTVFIFVTPAAVDFGHSSGLNLYRVTVMFYIPNLEHCNFPVQTNPYFHCFTSPARQEEMGKAFPLVRI